MIEQMKIPTLEMEVPQISPITHVSHDYFNEIYPIFLGIVNMGFDHTIGFLKKQRENGDTRIVRSYEERFSNCKNVVNEQNRIAIARIDKLAKKMNEILSDLDNVDQEALRTTYNELVLLIYGHNNNRELLPSHFSH